MVIYRNYLIRIFINISETLKPTLNSLDIDVLFNGTTQVLQNIIFKPYEPRHEKTNVLVSDLVRYKSGCTATEDDKRLEISDLERRGIVQSM